MIRRALVTVPGAADPRTAGTVVVIPARNEADRIVPCLASLAAQQGPAPVVSLCVNNTSDDTAGAAVAAARDHGLTLLLTEACYNTGGVGRARRIGVAAALRHCLQARFLLTTDADCIAAPGWVPGLARALARAPVVLGGIDGMAGEAEALCPSYHAWSWIEDRYAAMAIELACLLDPEGPDGIGLNTAGGASLGFRQDAYLALGGFRPLLTGEDRDIVARALAAGMRPVRAPGAVVAASMRSDGRAPMGMAARVAARLARAEVPLDQALLPLDALIAHALCPNAGQPPASPMTRRQAFRDYARLAACVARLRALPDPRSRRRFLTGAPTELAEPLLREG